MPVLFYEIATCRLRPSLLACLWATGGLHDRAILWNDGLSYSTTTLWWKGSLTSYSGRAFYKHGGTVQGMATVS